MIKSKKERVRTNEKRQLANIKASAKVHGAASIPHTLRLAASLPEHGKGRPVKRKELMDDREPRCGPRPPKPCSVFMGSSASRDA